MAETEREGVPESAAQEAEMPEQAAEARDLIEQAEPDAAIEASDEPAEEPVEQAMAADAAERDGSGSEGGLRAQCQDADGADAADDDADAADGDSEDDDSDDDADDEDSDGEDADAEDSDDDEDMAPYAGPALDSARPDVPARPAPIGLPLDDPALAPSIELARAAILEVTDEADLGEVAGVVDDGDGVYSIQFATTRPGYPDWRWTATLVDLEGQEGPTVLETEMLPGADALLAPAWVPWAERLAEYEAAQAAAEDEGEQERRVRRVERTRQRRRVRSGDADASGESAAVEPAEQPEHGAEAPCEAEQPRERGERERRPRQRRRIVIGPQTAGRAQALRRPARVAEGEDAAPDAEGPELVPVVDIREFADERDRALHGVEFEVEPGDGAEGERG